jgi:alpha,alpha-trehalase
MFNREDYKVAENYDTEEKKNEFYVRIKSAAETGWDFSSRWFITANGSDHGQYLRNVYTSGVSRDFGGQTPHLHELLMVN